MNAAAAAETRRVGNEPIGEVGMWVFIVSEVLFFGALMTAYVVYRQAYSASFSAASHKLDFWLGTLNTAVLLTSSFAMALAVHSARRARTRAAIGALSATTVLGLAFLAIKAFEYHKEFTERLAPWRPGANFATGTADPGRVELFFNFYYAMTGLHALHMMIGIAVVLTVIALTAKRSAAQCTSTIQVTGLYWHFVDVVWVFLYPLLYLVGR